MKNKYKILAVTLARGGSKGVKRKNIINVNGIPLIAYTVIEALRSKLITDYIVSTDDDEVAATAKKYGALVPFKRPKNLSSDVATSTDALIHAVEFCEMQNSIKYDYVIELMCTNPLKTSLDIDSALIKLIKTKADSVIGMSKLDDNHPARIKKIVDDKIVDFCVPEISSRRQDLKPDAFIRNGSIYALKRNTLVIKKERFGSDDSRPFIMPYEKSINIDGELDLKLAEYIIKMDKSREYIYKNKLG